jgi:multidrug efflux system membrane fusion protein
VLIVGRDDSGHVVRFAVADRQVVRVRRGDAATVQLDAWPGERFEAEVTQVAGAADAATGLFPIEARIDAAGRTLVSGLVARVAITPAADAATLPHVPIGAVLEGHGERAAVFVAEGGIAHRRDVQVAFISAGTVAVRDGLAVGKQVIAAGAPYLDDGDPIAVVP